MNKRKRRAMQKHRKNVRKLKLKRKQQALAAGKAGKAPERPVARPIAKPKPSPSKE
ncbi:MAG: hypothetical protein HYX97_06835 [Chloroflexi bacterium]|nr:hypothetical protein [Chloroflexota bacterium]